ncbi:hypothetical protein [Streptomyces sp. cmx-4-9]|uniref:hypothetical protein n=1 Tax=Streptomyces sp. cmx-4-9 TaxID=2790941 RepID=UPI00398146AA
MTDEEPGPGPYAPPATAAGAAGGAPAGAASATACEGSSTAEAAGPEPSGPAPLGLVRTPTGHTGVDAALARLAEADHLAADGHLAVYEDVHRGLRSALTALDAPPAPGPYENRS